MITGNESVRSTMEEALRDKHEYEAFMAAYHGQDAGWKVSAKHKKTNTIVYHRKMPVSDVGICQTCMMIMMRRMVMVGKSYC